jgi:predicted deacylase
MKKNRRDFVKQTGLAGIGLAGSGFLKACATGQDGKKIINRVVVDNAVATLEDGRVISTPFWRVDSGKEGPSLALIASQHGNEVQGAEVARRFKDICTRELVTGSVWLIPMGNILAVRSRRHSFNLGPEENNSINPEKLHNMQRHWPGDPAGNDTARLAYALDQKVLRHCSHLMDMHCWNNFAAAEALSEETHETSRKMGDATTTRFISYRNTVVPATEKMMVSQMMLKRGAGVIVMELSGQFRIKERQVLTGLSSMVNIAKSLGMINGEMEPVEGKRAVRKPENTRDIKAPCTGLFVPAAGKDSYSNILPDDFIEEGQVLGHIIRDKDLETIPVLSPVAGYLRQLGACHWGLCDASLPAQHPYTEEGETLALIVSI